MHQLESKDAINHTPPQPSPTMQHISRYVKIHQKSTNIIQYWDSNTHLSNRSLLPLPIDQGFRPSYIVLAGFATQAYLYLKILGKYKGTLGSEVPSDMKIKREQEQTCLCWPEVPDRFSEYQGTSASKFSYLINSCDESKTSLERK